MHAVIGYTPADRCLADRDERPDPLVQRSKPERLPGLGRVYQGADAEMHADAAPRLGVYGRSRRADSAMAIAQLFQAPVLASAAPR